MKTINLLLPILLVCTFGCQHQIDKNKSDAAIQTSALMDENPPRNPELFNLILEKDSLLFQLGFNQIDTSKVIDLAAEDFEFYHDVHGITDSKKAFVNSIQGIKDLPFKTWRKLNKASMEVFPLYKNNRQELYGAIQTAFHDFYQQKPGEDARKTNIARFTHLWIIENGDWKLKRVLSYDHQVPE